MPAQSQQQQKLFGLALAVKRGEVPASEVSDEVKAIVDRMSEKDIEDFAGTSHKGLPKKVEAQIREMVREIMKERAIAEMNENENPCWKGYKQIGMKMKDGKEVPNCVPKNESVNEAKNIKVTFRSKAAKKRYMKKQSLQPNSKEIVNQTDISLTLTPDMKDYVSKKSHGDLIYQIESVNEDTKKRFDVDFYKGNGDRQTSHEEIIRGDKFSDVVSQATKVAKSKGMNYVEFYHRDSFIGSIDKRNGYQFKKGRNYQKSPLSVTEVASRTAMEIGGLTGMNKDAIQKFVDDNNLDIEKVFQFVKKGKLKDRMDLVSAIVGKPNNPIQKKIIKMFGESVVNEGASTEEKRIVMMAVKKIAKYRNVPLDYAVGDVMRAAQELERDIKKGKVK